MILRQTPSPTSKSHFLSFLKIISVDIYGGKEWVMTSLILTLLQNKRKFNLLPLSTHISLTHVS